MPINERGRGGGGEYPWNVSNIFHQNRLIVVTDIYSISTWHAENCNYSFHHILSFSTFSLWPCTESQDKKNPIFANLLMLRNCLATQGNCHERSWNGGLALGVVQAILQLFQTILQLFQTTESNHHCFTQGDQNMNSCQPPTKPSIRVCVMSLS